MSSLIPEVLSDDQRVMDYLSLNNPNPEFVETMLRHWHHVENARRKLGLPISTTSRSFEPTKE